MLFRSWKYFLPYPFIYLCILENINSWKITPLHLKKKNPASSSHLMPKFLDLPLQLSNSVHGFVLVQLMYGNFLCISLYILCLFNWLIFWVPFSWSFLKIPCLWQVGLGSLLQAPLDDSAGRSMWVWSCDSFFKDFWFCFFDFVLDDLPNL